MPSFGIYNPAHFGWTASPHREHIVRYSYDGVPFPNGVHTATVNLWNLFLTELKPHVTGGFKNSECWGYTYRDVAGSNVKSFHAYGLALDVNAPDNVISVNGTATPHAMPSVAGSIAKKYGMEWGGSWTTPKDYMHFEIHLSPNEVFALVKQHTTHTPTPSQFEPFQHIEPGKRTIQLHSAGTDVQYVQRWLGITQDGLFGRITDSNVRRYQRMRGITVDGIVGPVTWNNMGV